MITETNDADIGAVDFPFEENPILDSIRDEPRFIATLNKIKADNVAMLAQLNAGLSVEAVLNEEW